MHTPVLPSKIATNAVPAPHPDLSREVTLELNGGGNFIFGVAEDSIYPETIAIRTVLGLGVFCVYTGRCLEANHHSLGNYRIAAHNAVGGTHLCVETKVAR